jgi:hypothetical protein
MPAGEIDRVKFPHLLPGEVRTWRWFLRDHQNDYDRFDYDVHLGEGSLPQELPPGPLPAVPAGEAGASGPLATAAPSVYAENFRWLTRKRADVIGWQGSQPTIFEIRPRASLPLVGQLIGYRHLWMRAHPDSEPPALILVTEFIQPDDQSIFDAEQIPVFIVKPPAP